MSTILSGIRNITMRRGTSVSRTISLNVQRADISTVSFVEPNEYSTQPEPRRDAFVDTTHYAALSGLDAAGADSVELSLIMFATSPCLPSDQFCLVEASIRAREQKMLIPLSV
jgi:hypothetical protein